MNSVHACDAATASVDVSRVVQLRAVLCSIRNQIVTARDEGRGPRSTLFELHALAEAGVALADCAMEEAL
jgi:hypothetical protein